MGGNTHHPSDFQSLIIKLQQFWADYGCVLLQPYDVEMGECQTLYDYDCNGELGGTAELDECGVCDGVGVIQDCGCGTLGEFGIPQGDCDCDGNILDACGDCGGDGSACEPGTLDIFYNIDVEFGGFQFNVNGTTVTGVDGGIS